MEAGPAHGGLRLQAAERGGGQVEGPHQHRPWQAGGEVTFDSEHERTKFLTRIQIWGGEHRKEQPRCFGTKYPGGTGKCQKLKLLLHLYI